MNEQSAESVRGGHAPAGQFTLEVAAISDTGRRRGNNEDCFGYDLQARLFVVCDGMGGMPAGEVASGLAVERAIEAFSEPRLAAMPAEQRLHAAIAAAHKAVRVAAGGNRALHGMGTTLVAACILDNHVVIGNVGDSRAYFLRGDGCVQITEDHSLGSPRARDQAAVHTPIAQYITRAIGAGDTVEPDYFVAELHAGDTILLTTDGLTRYTEAERIATELSRHATAEEMCRALVGVAYEGGASDNVTCLLIRVH
jgi:serine/threonine protein phosphatase PrpC